MHAAERLLKREDKPNEQVLGALAKAEAQFTRTGAIIQRIRGFAGKGRISRGSEDITAMLDEVIELACLDPRSKGVEIECDIAANVRGAMIDKVQIQQVLLNLLRNAFEAMAGRSGRRIAIAAELKADLIEITVADTGPGLAPAIAENCSCRSRPPTRKAWASGFRSAAASSPPMRARCGARRSKAWARCSASPCRPRARASDNVLKHFCEVEAADRQILAEIEAVRLGPLRVEIEMELRSPGRGRSLPASRAKERHGLRCAASSE